MAQRAESNQRAAGRPASRQVTRSPDILEGLLRSGDDAIDRKALAGLLVEIAQSLKPELRAQQNGVRPGRSPARAAANLAGRPRDRDVVAARRRGGRSRALGRRDRAHLADRDRPGDERYADGARVGARHGEGGGELDPQRSHDAGQHPLSDDRAGHPQIDRRDDRRDVPAAQPDPQIQPHLAGAQMALGGLAHRTAFRRGRAQAYAGLPGRTRVPGPPTHRAVDRPCGGRECSEPRPAARFFDAGRNPGFCPRFLQRRRAPGARTRCNWENCGCGASPARLPCWSR